MAGGSVVLASHDAGGTVPPMLALAEAFVARGHQVTWLGQPSIESRARTAGCNFSVFPGVDDYERRTPIEEQLDTTLPLITGAHVGEHLISVAETVCADLVVVDGNLAGCLAAAETTDARSAVLLHSMFATFTQTWFADLWPFLGPVINETRRHFAVREAEGWMDVFSRHDRIISAVPRRFDAPVAELPLSVRHFGFLVPQTSVETDGADFEGGDTPTVLVGLSTTYQGQEQLLGAILEALGSLAVRGLVSTAGQVDASTLLCPANVQMHERIHHAAVLDHVDVMVTHAGLGSVAAGLSHGVPLVCTPLGRDQHLNADRVVTTGAGVQLGADPTPEDIAEAVELVLTHVSYRESAQEVALDSRAAGGAVAAVEDLEALHSR